MIERTWYITIAAGMELVGDLSLNDVLSPKNGTLSLRGVLDCTGVEFPLRESKLPLVLYEDCLFNVPLPFELESSVEFDFLRLCFVVNVPKTNTK